jgi:hypothetical protein
VTLRARVAWIVVAALCCAAGAGASLVLGLDNNWDLLNYHLYNPWAILENRWGIDHHPGNEPGFLNPLLDLIVYPLATMVPDRVGGAILGAFQGFAFLALFVAAREAIGGSARSSAALIATVGGATSAMTISEIGTTFGDLTTAVLVLAALALALRACTRPDARRLPWRLGVAGALVGIATGFKLTNGLFALGLAAGAVLAVPGPRWRTLSWLLAPATLGLLATHGWWSAFLWSHYGSPVFPFANELFQSAWYGTFTPLRFFPPTLGEALFYPFYFGFNHRTAEVPFRDLRMAAAYTATPLLAVLLFARTRLASPPPAFAPPVRASVFLIAFMAVAYGVWLRAFAIERYIVVLEMLAPLAAILLLGNLVAPRTRNLLALAFVGALIVTTHPANWRRAPWDGDRWSRLRNFEVPSAGSAVIVGAHPLAFLAPTVGAADIAWISTNGAFSTLDHNELERRIAGRKLYLAGLAGGETDAEFVAAVELYQLKPAVPCASSWSKLGPPVVLCPVTRGAGMDVASLANASERWSFALEPRENAITLFPGEKSWVRMRIRNTGNAPAWAELSILRLLAGLPRRATDEVSLSYHVTSPGGEMIIFDGLRTPLPRSLAPGEEAEFEMCIQAPALRGTYAVKLDVVHEGVAWMGPRATGASIALTVR